MYTDGTVQVPTIMHVATAGIGLWIPKEAVQNDLDYQSIYPYAKVDKEKKGIAIYMALPSHITSSTRAELAAANMALALPHTFKLKSDSMAFV